MGLQKIEENKEIKGARIEVSGRLNGAEIARREWLAKGRLPRQTLRANIDYAFAQDGTAPLAIQAFKKMGGRKVFNSKKAALVIDHSAPSPNIGVSELHKLMRSFAQKEKIKLFDIGQGVCHQLMVESGNVLPGDLVVGADSHTCTYGAINAASTGVGSTDLASAIISGKLWFKVPSTIKFNLSGKLPLGVMGKDLILYLIGLVSSDGATYKAVEFSGEAIKHLSMDGRFAITNMAVEMGAKFGLMEIDSKARRWIKNYTQKKIHPVKADKDAKYEKIIELNVSKLSPQIAKPHQVDNVSPVGKLLKTKIDEAFIGTCTGGRLEDLEVASRILKGKKIHPRVELIVVPASKSIYLEAVRKGIISNFIKSGAVVSNPGCGPCVGTQAGIPAKGYRVISTANRNFKGRMGSPGAFIYLASPATVAASAIKGEITDPRKYL